MIPTEIVVLFTLEAMVKSCDLAPHGAKRRAAEPESAMGHTSPGGMLWGVTCSLEYTSSRRVLTPVL